VNTTANVNPARGGKRRLGKSVDRDFTVQTTHNKKKKKKKKQNKLRLNMFGPWLTTVRSSKVHLGETGGWKR